MAERVIYQLTVHVSPSHLLDIGERFVNVPILYPNGIEGLASPVQNSFEISDSQGCS